MGHSVSTTIAQHRNPQVELTAATTSLQSGSGPFGTGPVSCSLSGPETSRCETIRNYAVESATGAGWTNITSTNHPAARSEAVLTYDGADGYVLLFGGRSLPGGAVGPNPYRQDTWKFSGAVWTNITVPGGPSPPAAVIGGMAYDPADGYVLLFSLNGETWKFSAGSWSKIVTTPSPYFRGGGALTYDTADGYMVLFGGGTPIFTGGHLASIHGLADTWKFLAGTWTNITSSTGPTGRLGAMMTYDASDGYAVLFGGVSGFTVNVNGQILPDNYLADTWKFSGGVWTRLTTSDNPSPRFGAGIAYDPVTANVLLFGGLSNSIFTGDTWKFSAGAWTNITSVPSPSNRADPAMVYDVADGHTLLFGGGGPSTPAFLDTWTLKVAAAPTFDYTLSVTPTSISLTAGSSATVTISATLTSGTAQLVTLLGSISPQPPVCQPVYGVSPCGTITLSPPSITPSLTGATSTLTISTTTVVPPGAYTATITGSPSGKSSSSAVFTFTVTSPATPDFVISANPTSLTLSPEDSEVCQGPQATSTCDDEGHVTITVTALNGFTGQVALSVSSSPNLSTELTKTTIDTAGTSTIKISEGSPGSYVVTVTGTSGLSHQATVDITVRAPEKLKCGGQDKDCVIESDAPLSNIVFSGHTIRFSLTGEKGSIGAANVTIPKTGIPDISRLKVLVDHVELSKSFIKVTQDNSNYNVYFTFTFHSTADVELDLNPSTSTIIGLEPLIFYGIIGAIIVVGAVAAIIAIRKRRPMHLTTNTKP